MFSSTSPMVIILVWFLCATMLNLSLGNGNIVFLCNEKDQRTLSIFKQSIKDPSNHLSSWSIEKDCCNWVGVVCNNITGRVTELHLSGLSNYLNPVTKNLSGEINFSYLIELESLTFLDLSWNDFEAIYFEWTKNQSHKVPLKAFSSPTTNFPNLMYLDLSYNLNLQVDNLKWLPSFSSLKYLNLSLIDLSNETLHWMSALPSLVELRLSGCYLNGTINPSPGNIKLTSLAVLDVSFNFFTEIPKWLFNLSSVISYLDLGFNDLRGQIPATRLSFQHLKSLILRNNYLNGSIPEWMGQFKHLEQLDLSSNLLSGPIPATIGNLSLLTNLQVGYNRLNGSLPRTLGQLSKLETLSVSYNSLSGNLSEQSFTKLSSLTVFEIDSSAFTFDFGTNWQPPFQLESISMSNCKIGLEFPSWLYTQRYLESFDISSSGLAFNAHDKVWSFVTRIEFLTLFNNSISGDISTKLISNTAIDLSSNNFTGRLPHLSPRVLFFNIANNSFSGPIHPLLCQNMTGKRELTVLDMSHNHLSGEFPNCWMHWQSLKVVNLEGNNLIGKISDTLGSLIELETLRLGDNFLSEEIHFSLKSCKNLRFLDLAFNELTGNIPNWIRPMNIALLLQSNKLNGSIPSQICQLSNLLVLNLANNRLSGPIPKCLYNITTMVYNTLDESLFESFSYPFYLTPSSTTSYVEDLFFPVKSQNLDYWKTLKYARFIDLSTNELLGSIPSELFSLVAVQSLNLSHNHLTGKISSDIGHMRFLESLDLSRC